MPAFQNASKADIQYLLELFPVINLRKYWNGGKKHKEELCAEISSGRNKKDIVAFISKDLYSCKQHVHVFSHNEGDNIAFPEAVCGGERVAHIAGVSALYIIKVRHKVILNDPLENDHIDFLWPVLLEILPEYLLVRFVSLEKDLASHFQRPCIVRSRSVDEADVLLELKGIHAEPSDLHKGVKALWEDGFMDAIRTKYKKPHSEASETMDEAKGIRQSYPELYAILRSSTLLNTLFIMEPKAQCGVSAMSANPSAGLVTFPRYSDEAKGTDYVVAEILKHNK
jgi:hypothetical protein